MGYWSAVKLLHYRNRRFRRFSYPLPSKMRKEFDYNSEEQGCYMFVNQDAV